MEFIVFFFYERCPECYLIPGDIVQCHTCFVHQLYPILLEMQLFFRALFLLLHMHGRQRQDLGPLLLPELCGNDTAHARSNGLASLVDQHAGVVVELDHASVRSLPLLRCPHYDGVPHVSTSHLVRRADGHAVARLGAEVSLLLHDHDDTVACYPSTAVPCWRKTQLTYRLLRGASSAGR